MICGDDWLVRCDRDPSALSPSVVPFSTIQNSLFAMACLLRAAKPMNLKHFILSVW